MQRGTLRFGNAQGYTRDIIFFFACPARALLIGLYHVTDCPRQSAGMRAPPDAGGGRSMAVFRDDEDRQL